MRKYESAAGRYTDSQADRMGRELMTLSNSLDKELQPQDVVRWAKKNKRSEIHKQMDWNDTSAANKWRMQQARLIICDISIIDSGESESLRAFHSVVVDRGTDQERRRYVPLISVTKSEDEAEQVVATAKREIADWKNRYRKYRNYLSQYFDGLDGV